MILVVFSCKERSSVQRDILSDNLDTTVNPVQDAMPHFKIAGKTGRRKVFKEIMYIKSIDGLYLICDTTYILPVFPPYRQKNQTGQQFKIC
jgi:hypothetical protein